MIFSDRKMSHGMKAKAIERLLATYWLTPEPIKNLRLCFSDSAATGKAASVKYL